MGVTIQEYRVQSVPASGTPVPLARAPGSQNGVAMRVDPAMGYAVAVYAVDTSNRLSGPSNVVNTAGAPTATPIPAGTPGVGQAPYGYGGAPVVGTPGTQPYGGAYTAPPNGSAYSQAPYGSAYTPVPYGSPYTQAPYGNAILRKTGPARLAAGWQPPQIDTPK